MRGVGACGISAFEEGEQRGLGIGGGADLVIAQEEFAEGGVPRAGTHLLLPQSLRHRRGVAVERGLAVTAIPGPPARADDLMRVGLLLDFVRTRRPGCLASAEACDAEIEAAPEEVHRTDLPLKSCRK